MSKGIHYIDIHSHLNFPQYAPDRDTVISRAKEASVAIINVGTDIETSKEVVVLAESNETMWAIVGCHPTDAGTSGSFDLDGLKKLASHPKVVAIGECGLDFFHLKATTPEEVEKEVTIQRDIFIKHIEIANAVGKPLMLHVRNSKDSKIQTSQAISAYQEAIALLKQHAKVKSNFHFFAGTPEDLKSITDAGYSVSFTGVLTFTKDYDALVRNVPASQIMSETDAPFVAPVPYRGKRNEPAYVIEVVKAIARIRGEDEEKVSRTLADNAKKFFNIEF
jgi:TatD DNase family protein